MARKALQLVNKVNTQVYDVPKLLESRDDSANAIYIHTNGGPLESINIESSKGQDNEGYSAINITAEAGSVAVTGLLGLYLRSVGDSTSNINVYANGSTSVSDTGASIQLYSEKGGVALYSNINANASGAIYLHAPKSSSLSAINIVADAGGITLDPLDSKGVTIKGVVDITGTAAASPASGLVLGNVTRGVGGASGTITLKTNSSSFSSTTYLSVYVGSTPYYIPLLQYDPQTH
uniref:Uncharacterized protein n=1 Tax=viral metagenome TaxID=1070528 RepID=A0A6C0EEZ1_9ZZZZ